MIIRVFLSLLSLAMLGCLTAYAIGHVSAGSTNPGDGERRIAAPANGPIGVALRPMRPMADAEMAAADQERVRQRQESLNRELAQREAAIVAQLDLGEEQMRQYEALQDEMREQNEALREFDGNRISRGMEINQELHRRLREVFTAEQYEKYRRLWNGPDLAAPVASKSEEQADVGRSVDEEGSDGDGHSW